LTEEDTELEKLKKSRLAEMQKNISSKQKREEFLALQKEKLANAPKPREILVSRLGHRGLEVLENAETQFPNETKIVVEKLAELISTGEINEELDGGKLLLLFRSIGLNIHVQTTINVEQDGKFVSLSDKLGKFSNYNESSNQQDNE